MRIVGLDIGKLTATAAALEEMPANLQRYYREHKQEILTLAADGEGAEKLLEMKPDGIVLEPTGFWYSAFWYELAKVNKIPVHWMGHRELKKNREHYGFTNKSDAEDALCLAASYFDPNWKDEHDRQRFLKNYLADEILEVRELFYQIEQLDKLRNAQINHLRQRLCAEFPEIAKMKIQRGKNQYSPLLGWIAGIRKHTRIDNIWKKSKSKELGLGIKTYTREHAKSLIDLEIRISEGEKLLSLKLENEEFTKYLKIFDLFGFGQTLKALFLINTYPFERFLINGRTYTERDVSKKGKRVTRHRSLGEFQAYCGLAYSYEQSGKERKKKFHGSALIRSHLYIFLTARITPGRPLTEEEKAQGKKDTTKFRVQSPIGQELGKSFDKQREHLHGKDAITRLMFKTTRRLFYELYRELKD